MRTPKWFKEKIATEGEHTLSGATTEGRAAQAIADHILAARAEFVRDVIIDFVRRQLTVWAKQHEHGPYASDDEAQLDLFPDIPRRLETAPGRFADQAVMTRKDWNNAVKQARTKANNASGFAEAIETVADKVVPLFCDDEETTAEVVSRSGLLAAAGGA